MQILVYMLSTVPEQQIRFESEAIARADEFDLPPSAHIAGRMFLFPRVFMLELRLEQGRNPIKVAFSGALEPTQQRPAPLAAYLTRVRIKTMGQ